MKSGTDISIVIPAKDEGESIAELSQWISRVMETHGFSYEVIFIDDGSTDNTWQEMLKANAANPSFKALRFNRNFGKSAALHTGFKAAHGDVVITMDADLQDSPEEIPALYKMIKEQGYQLVSGWKKKRHDPISKTVPSRFFNFITRKISGIKIHDFNCGLKAYSLVVVKNIETNPERINLGVSEPVIIFRTNPIQTNTYPVRARLFQYYGRHRIILYKINAEYAALYQDNGRSSLNIKTPFTNVINGLGIFTGINSDTVMLRIKKN